MEKTRSISIWALFSLVVICASAGAVLGNNAVRRSMLTPGVGANTFVQLGKPGSGPLQRPDILFPDKTASTGQLGVPVRSPVDFNGDGKTDFVVVRNTGGGASGQLTGF